MLKGSFQEVLLLIFLPSTANCVALVLCGTVGTFVVWLLRSSFVAGPVRTRGFLGGKASKIELLRRKMVLGDERRICRYSKML